MDIGSTASSGTSDPQPDDTGATVPAQVTSMPGPAATATPGPTPTDAGTPEPIAPDAGAPEPIAAGSTADELDASEHDPSRRAFFLSFGRQAVTAAGQVAGMTDLLGRASGGGIAGLLGMEPAVAPGVTAATRPGFVRSSPRAVVSAAVPAAEDVHRSAYRLAGDELVLLDQRSIPESLDEVVARRGSDVAYYLRLGVARGGSLMAQVAAYGIALTARERESRPAQEREVELQRTRQSLVRARPSSRLLAWSAERMRLAAAALDPSAGGHDVAAVLRAEADAIASDLRAWNASAAVFLADQLVGSHDDPVVLLHGVHGALAGGTVGSGLAALQRLRQQGREPRIFLTEGRPFMDGARLAAWELRQAGFEHKVIADSAVAWLLQREAVDAVLISAEWIAANGDTGALVGSRAVAQLAADSGARVIVAGVSACVDESTADGAAIPEELRPASDLTAYLAAVPIRTSDALVPAADVVPAAAISALVTEGGRTTPAALAWPGASRPPGTPGSPGTPGTPA
jgi:methylthioribose-1-phosphate isomerase